MGEFYICPSGGYIAAGRHRFPANARIAIWGQSNAWGAAARADISASPLSSDAELAAFNAGTFSRVYIWNGSAYAQLQPTVNNKAAANCFGAEFAIAVRWMRETTTGNLYIDKEAFSGVSIAYFDPSNAYYVDMRYNRTLANAWLSARSISVTDSGWLWIQGETDAAQTQSWYQTRLEALIAARSTDGMQNAATKRVLMQMAVGSLNYSATIVAAKSAIASASPTNTVAPYMPHYMNGDNQHQNGRGQVQAGYDAFAHIFGAPTINT